MGINTSGQVLNTPIEKSSDLGSKLFKDDKQIADLKVKKSYKVNCYLTIREVVKCNDVHSFN